MTSETKPPLLEVRNLKTYFFTEDGVIKAVDGVDFYVRPGEVLGLVGESGCGKSVTSLSIMRLIGTPGKIVDGEMLFEGRDLVKASEAEMMKIRGNRISMIFQQPQSALNPVFRAGDQISEVLQIHQGLDKKNRRQRAVEMLRMVGIPEPERRAEAFPHELSGGMAQRVMIAMALACAPDLLIADEPTTALDVTIQAQILEVMSKLSREFGTAVIIITHNLGVVARYADRVNVMYAGRVIETAAATELYANPKHPYTVGLLNSVPRLDETRKEKLVPIEGLPPDLAHLPPGCSFYPRCSWRVDRCKEEYPPFKLVAENHYSACWESDRVRREAAVGAAG